MVNYINKFERKTIPMLEHYSNKSDEYSKDATWIEQLVNRKRNTPSMC